MLRVRRSGGTTSLWRKPLPSGVLFELVDTTPGVYLYHRSQLGEFRLASDAVIPTFRKEARIAHISEQSPDELADFLRLSYTIGGMMLFPGNRASSLADHILDSAESR